MGSYSIVIIFTSVHRVPWEGGGQWLPYACFNVDYDALHFLMVLLKINIFKLLFWQGGREGVTKKEYAFDNVENCGRPLTVHTLGQGKANR